MKKLYDSTDINYAKPFGAIAIGNTKTLRVRIPFNKGWEQTKRVNVVIRHESEEALKYQMLNTGQEEDEEGTRYLVFQAELNLPKTGIYFYYFEVEFYYDENKALSEKLRNIVKMKLNGDIAICAQARMIFDEERKYREGAGETCLWQITVYEKDQEARSNVFYQIFPDRFYRGNKGKRTIYSRRLHENWNEIPEFLPDNEGKITNTDFFGGDLRGIILKLDYIKLLGVEAIYLNPINKSASSHRYDATDYMLLDDWVGNDQDFMELCSEAKKRGIGIIIDIVFNHVGVDNPYYLDAITNPNSKYKHWFCYDKDWWGMKNLVILNLENPEVQAYLIAVLKRYVGLGVSGIRVDVADELSKELLSRMYKTIKEADASNSVILEVWEDATLKEGFSGRKNYFTIPNSDGVMNYVWRKAILDYIRYGNFEIFFNKIMAILENYPKFAILSSLTLLSSHDVERALTMLVGEEYTYEVDRLSTKERRMWQYERNQLSDEKYILGVKMFQLAMILQVLLPGSPCIYAGDEVGMSGYKDPFNRYPYQWENGDKELLEFCRKLMKARERLDINEGVDLTFVNSGDADLAVFERLNDYGKKIIVAINRSDVEKASDILKVNERDYLVCFTCGEVNNGMFGAYSAVILLEK